LAQTLLETKNATIESLQAANLHYKQLLGTNAQSQGQLSSTSAGETQRDEPILGGAITITPYVGKGFQMNLPFILQGRQVIATAQVAEQDGAFVGRVDLSVMPVPLRGLFEEYEEIVNSQTFSLLDEAEEKIENLHLKVIFEDGYEAALADVQIYPSTNKVSFQVIKGGISRPSGISGRALMERDFSSIQALVERPGESLSGEIIRWIDPNQPEGVATIVRAALALRNHGGGYIVIGFDNKTLQPDQNNVPPDVRALFHIDKIQWLISKFASEPFEVTVEFPERDGQLHPIIVIPAGVKTPVATKSDLRVGDKALISADSVYIRSLRANNTPSTTIATWKDWSKIVEVCFDNREADVSRFLRRHLGSLTPNVMREFMTMLSQGIEPEATTEELLQKYLQESEDRFQTVARERKPQLPEHGTWEVALLLIGQVPSHAANHQFLNLLDASNPRYTGWPIWLDTRRSIYESARPRLFRGVWEAFIALGSSRSSRIDFMRLDPKGRFYLRRALREDVSDNRQPPAPMTTLDFSLPITNTAEAMAVGVAFAKAMGCPAEDTQLAFAFRWTKLQGRRLTSWLHPDRDIFPEPSAYRDEVLTFVDVPLETLFRPWATLSTKLYGPFSRFSTVSC
jgi:hypothetical protein